MDALRIAGVFSWGDFAEGGCRHGFSDGCSCVGVIGSEVVDGWGGG